MSLAYTVRPLTDRTIKPEYEHSRFRMTWTNMQKLVERELWAITNNNSYLLVMEVDVPEGMIRLDGALRADARPSSPVVRLAFDSIHGPLIYGCGRYATWHDNVYAIGLTLQALRAIDRYGATGHGEQYTGFKAITAATTEQTADPRDVLFAVANAPRTTEMSAVWKIARATAHPDRNGGDRRMWDQVENAGRVLALLP